jgi:Asp-tRNA(Asn)/Glu-tRNA(Gln) amidotransferase A subunit family amidase
LRLKPVRLPDYPYQAVTGMIAVEAAVAFEDLVTGGHLDSLVNEGPRAWKSTLPAARLTPAVQYLKAQQIRALMQSEAARLMQDVDVWVAPGVGPASPVDAPPSPPASDRPRPKTLAFTNLTGQPTVCVPGGFVDGLPVGLQFVGRCFDEASPLRLALAYQETTGWDSLHPKI